MSLAILCCQSLEQEIKAIFRDVPEVTHLEVMDWKLHIDPDLLLKTVIEKIEVLQDHVDAVVLGYGRCQAMDRLPNDFKVPIFRPDADDCIGILLGQDRYAKELYQEAGTWFFTPGWTEMGMAIRTIINPKLEELMTSGADLGQEYKSRLIVLFPGKPGQPCP